MSRPGAGWLGANQRYLMAVLDGLRAMLADHAAKQRGATAGPGSRPDLDALGRAMTPPPALVQVCAAFDLSPFERDVLMLCAGVELEGAFASHCAAAHGDPKRTAPTFGLALAVLPGAHWSALTPGAPLRHWRLVEPVAGEPLTSSPLRIDERVLHHLTGIPDMDERLRGLVDPVPPLARLAPSHAALGRRLAAALDRRPDHPRGRVVHLWGPDRSGRRAVAAAACQAAGLHLAVLHARDLPAGALERDGFLRLWEREALLTGAVLLLECDDIDAAEVSRTVAPLAERMHGPLVVSVREPLRLGARGTLRLEVDRPSSEAQRGLWREALGHDAGALEDRIDEVVSHFALGASEIEAAAAQAVAGATGPGPDALGPALWQACRVQSRSRLEDLAQRILPAATWEHLVLPDVQRRTLEDIAAHVRQRTRVLETWGFARRGARGLGISALFAGPSGTGKTMAAEVLAGALDLDLYRIDLSQVVSKYIGETEKNLRRVFDAAEEGGAILLFDEADALFGKRSEVRDSHDRYANIEVSYLLQRMEQYRGLAILTTNRKESLDPAFLRRLSFVVQFPFPDLAQRAEIWRGIFPPATPTDGLDVERLARLNVSGGHIRNIALHGAFLAADAGEPVRMTHLKRAAGSEYAKLERSLPDTELGGRE